MKYNIYSIAFSRDNQRAFISDYSGNIKKIEWQANTNSRDKFQFSPDSKKVDRGDTHSICLTKDKKYLLVGSKAKVSILKTTTRELTKESKLTEGV